MNLAPREGITIPSGTPTNVGPNSYLVSYPCCKYRTTNYAPFLTFGKRGSIQSKCYTEAIYDPPAIRSKIKYGNSLQFTAPRVTIDVNLEPSPREELKRKPYCLSLKRKGNVGRLYACRVPFTRGKSAPSIPSHNDVNGYDITEDNDIVKIPPYDYDNTLGPAYYCVPSGELCFNTKKYRGCAWSKMVGQRSKFGVSDNPGPAEYNIKFITCPMHKEDEQFKALMRKCCNVPRHTCQLICRSINEGLPGPGYYEIVDIDKIGKLKNLSLKPRPFIDSSKRFVYKATRGPGPQHYLVCDCYKHRKDFSLLKDVPFLRNGLRFPANKIVSTPGPGHYNVTDVKCCRYQGKAASFNSSEVRKLLEVNNNNPGPGEYCVPMKGVRCCPQEQENQTSVFSSNVYRFVSEKDQDEPDPATYSIIEAYKYNNDKRSHATGKKVSFGTTEGKFSKIYDFAGIVRGIDTPSVGVYALPELSKSEGKSFATASRFPKKIKEKRPGPQTYTLSSVVVEAMYRGKTTHNQRLMKQVVKRADVHKPKTVAERKCKPNDLPDLKVEECLISGPESQQKSLVEEIDFSNIV